MELFRALGVLLEPPNSTSWRIGQVLQMGTPPAEPEHNELFLLQLYPYASVFLGKDGTLGGDPLSRIADWWRVMDVELPGEPDHLGTLLSAYAELADREIDAETAPCERSPATWRAVRRALLWEHMLPWIPVFTAKLRHIAPPFYQSWADMLDAALASEVERLGMGRQLPLALREAGAVADPRVVGGEEFVGALLSPVRSGLVLTRSDLAWAARDLGIGLRVGERRFILRSMLAQDAVATLEWVENEARAWRTLHRTWMDIAPRLSHFWAERAGETGRLVAELVDDIETGTSDVLD